MLLYDNVILVLFRLLVMEPIAEGDDEDWFSLQLEAGKAYQIETQTSDDTILVIAAPAGAELARNDDYWGGPADFATVSMVSMPNDASRVAALLSGDVDLIDSVPPESYERLKTDDDVEIFMTQDVYTAYVFLDTDRDVTPNITAKDGSEIPNPLKDVRVREALSLAINRDAIIDRARDTQVDWHRLVVRCDQHPQILTQC